MNREADAKLKLEAVIGFSGKFASTHTHVLPPTSTRELTRFMS